MKPDLHQEIQEPITIVGRGSLQLFPGSGMRHFCPEQCSAVLSHLKGFFLSLNLHGGQVFQINSRHNNSRVYFVYYKVLIFKRIQQFQVKSLLLFLAFFARLCDNIRIFSCILQSLGSNSNQSCISTSLHK
jgi:hypothetical protein